MNLQDQILLDTPDERLNSFARDRKQQLQKQIAARREAKQPLLADPNQSPKQMPSLADDQRNAFDRHAQSVRQARVASDSQAERVKRNEQEHERWRTTPKLDPITAELKQRSDASRTAAKQPAREVTISVYQACLAAGVQGYLELFVTAPTIPAGARHVIMNGYQTVGYVDAQGINRRFAEMPLTAELTWNREALNRLAQAQLYRGVEVTPELFGAAIAEGLHNNHFHRLPYRYDPVTGGRVSLRGEVLHPPTMPPAVIWPDEAVLLAQRQQEKALLIRGAETAEALKLDFHELESKVRANYKRGGDEAVR